MQYIIFTVLCCTVTYFITKYFIKKSIDLTVENSKNIYNHLTHIVEDLNKIKKDIY